MTPEVVIGPLVSAVVTIAAASIARRVRNRGAESATHDALIVLPPSVKTTVEPQQGWLRRALRRVAGAVPAFFGLLWRLFDRLPPLERRTKPWQATSLGFLLSGIGIAAYFRTALDIAVGIVLTIPLAIASAQLPEEGDQQTEVSGGPYWIYAFMGLSGLYAYLRATSSNRRRDAARSAPLPAGPVTGEPKSADERKALLGRLVQDLVAEGWRVEAQGEFDAVLVRRPRPNHALHGILTFLTLGVWGIVWIVRSRPRALEREIAAVDPWGNTRLELPGPKNTPPLAAPPPATL